MLCPAKQHPVWQLCMLHLRTSRLGLFLFLPSRHFWLHMINPRLALQASCIVIPALLAWRWSIVLLLTVAQQIAVMTVST